MVGMWMGALALLMIPLGFGLAWWMLRQLERRSAASEAPRRRPHPSSLPAVLGPLDDAPGDVIAAVARRLADHDPARRRPGDSS